MSIRWSCKCGNPLEVPDDFAARVVTCPKCIRSIAVPFPEEELSAEAQRYLKGDNRGNTKKFKKPIKCTYCGWLIWSADARECPKCLRKIEQPSIVTTIVSFALLTILVAGGWFGYRNWIAGGAAVEFEKQCRRFVGDRAAEWKKPDDATRQWLSESFPGAIAAGKEIEAEATFVEARTLGTVDGAQKGRVTYVVTLYLLDGTKPTDDPARRVRRATAKVEQRLTLDARSGRWVADGVPEIVDKTM